MWEDRKITLSALILIAREWHPRTIDRDEAGRDELRHLTDVTDVELSVTAPLMPAASSFGRPHLWSLREIVNGILRVLRGGVP